MNNNSNFYQNSIFWVEVDKIKPNPFQPRREFDPEALKALADSIKQYGVLQALVVTRREFEKPEGGLGVEYELIAGERRLRASKIAGLSQVPVLIRIGETDTKHAEDLMKLELAIIENVQREDLNPVERAKAFKKLADDFGFKHQQIAQKIGKSRVYVTNTMRILDLPEEMLIALSEGKINEGHTRPLLMLIERPEEQKVLFQDIMLRKMTVREAEVAARRIALERVRKINASIDPEIMALEEKFTESLGTRVRIEKKENGGKLMIEFFSNDDLEDILKMINKKENHELGIMNHGEEKEEEGQKIEDDRTGEQIKVAEETPIPTLDEAAKQEEELYSIKNFSL